MKKTANARFAITKWDEKPYSEVEGEPGLSVTKTAVIPGSATGDLKGLMGDGSSAVGHGMEHPFTLNYELP